MNKVFQNQKVIKVVRLIRPWVTFMAIFLILYYTDAFGPLPGRLALMKTSILNVDAGKTRQNEAFNYNFTIRDLEGRRVDFNQFKGKVVFINLWATWCGPCVAELPSIESLYGKVDKEKVAFVILDWFEDPAKVSHFIKNKKFTFPVYMVDRDVPQQLNVGSIPTTFVISPEGNIATKKVGTANYDTEKFKAFLDSF
jgi:thiol-disulfide isomerase/thioredoxin